MNKATSTGFSVASLSSSVTTSYKLVDPNDNVTDVVIHGHTPDSREWKAALKKLAGKKEKTTILLEKKQRKIEIDADTEGKREKLLVMMITDITGIDDWTYSEQAKKDLLEAPERAWILEKWGEHVDERSNFYGK